MNAPESSSRKVALLIETSNAYSRGILRGIAAYMQEHGRWSVQLAESSRGSSPSAWLRHWRGDGVIARIENRNISEALAPLDIPIVDVSASRLIPALPWVETDDAKIAELAARHLLERGLRNFAFCADNSFNWSVLREKHFSAILAREGHACPVFRSPPPETDDHHAELERLGEWLAGLPKPVGVFACYDFQGRLVLDACRRENLPVPDEVAVVGVDDDELLCELADPPLSSVIPDTHRTGYEAAALLDRLMSGGTVEPRAHLIAPLGVASRRSSDIVAVDDPAVSAALRFIRDRAATGICVKDVLNAVPVSRRLLEYRFKTLVGHTPHQEIIRTRIDRVKSLLRETDLPLEKIAALCGFPHVEYLSAAFRRESGIPPGQYRIRHRRKPHS